MPFGLVNGLAQFQRYVNSILRDYLDVFSLAYIDNILIFSNNEEEYERHV